MTIEELIAALERAEKHNWMLEGEIVDVLGLQKPEDVPHYQWPPRYTFSIDAALSLVPEGWHATINARPDWPTVELNEFPLPCRSVKLLHARTTAIALCIAALKARAAT